MADWLPPATLLGCIAVLGGVIGYLFRLLYNGIREERNHYRDQLMPSLQTLVSVISSLNQDIRAITDTQTSIQDNLKRIREELFYKSRGPE